MRLIMLLPGIILTLFILIGGLVLNPFATDQTVIYASDARAYLNGLAQQGNFHGTVLVAQNGQIVFEEGYGENLQTRFAVGSITKQFTAVAILQLVEAGKIQLQDPLCHFLPECPPSWHTILVEHLLTHTSGIPDAPDPPVPNFEEKVQQAPNIVDLLPYFFNAPLKFSPGLQYSYSNIGYVLLGYLLERVSGESYEGYMQRHIFEPTGLKTTSFECNGSNCASGFTKEAGKVVATTLPDLHLLLPAGGLYSTVEDLFRWDLALNTQKLVSTASLAKMFAAQAGNEWQGYGYGWNITKLGGRRFIWHAGLLPGFKSLIGRLPDQKLSVIILSNQDNGQNGIETELITRFFRSEVLSVSRFWVGLAGGIGLVWAALALLKVLLATLRQPGRVSWKQSLWLVSWVPVGASTALLAVGLIWNKTSWHWAGFGPTEGDRLVETIVPLMAGIGAAFLLSLEDEPALEVTLGCPRPYIWTLLERIALLVALYSSVGLIGSLATVVLGENKNEPLILMLRWLAPTIFLSGLALCTTLVTRQAVSGVGVSLIVWFGTLLGGSVLLNRFPWLWALHPYLQPGPNYLLNRLILILAGLALIALGTYLIRDTEWVLLGTGQGKTPKPQKQKEGLA
jgi:CubicO group peptidase (beta-lactamase class C family)